MHSCKTPPLDWELGKLGNFDREFFPIFLAL
jgi:hypothetical protein